MYLSSIKNRDDAERPSVPNGILACEVPLADIIAASADPAPPSAAAAEDGAAAIVEVTFCSASMIGCLHLRPNPGGSCCGDGNWDNRAGGCSRYAGSDDVDGKDVADGSAASASSHNLFCSDQLNGAGLVTSCPCRAAACMNDGIKGPSRLPLLLMLLMLRKSLVPSMHASTSNGVLQRLSEVEVMLVLNVLLKSPKKSSAPNASSRMLLGWCRRGLSGGVVVKATKSHKVLVVVVVAGAAVAVAVFVIASFGSKSCDANVANVGRSFFGTLKHDSMVSHKPSVHSEAVGCGRRPPRRTCAITSLSSSIKKNGLFLCWMWRGEVTRCNDVCECLSYSMCYLTIF